MEYRDFGRTGMRVSVLGLGCGGFGGVGSAPELFGKGEDRATAFALMNRAVDAGINYFDTADSYGGGESERVIGAWLKERKLRDQLILSTKVFYPIAEGPNDRSLSPRHIMQAIDGSLRRLQTDHVDLYVTMEPDPDTPEQETLTAMNDLVNAGKVRFIGSSNITGAQLRQSLAASDRLGGVRSQSVQNGYNLLDREIEDEILPLASREGLAVTPFSPTSGGLLTGKYQLGQAPPSDSRLALRPQPYQALMNEATFRSLAALRHAAEERGVEMGALALAWVLSHPAVTSALIGPRRLEQFAPWIAAVDIRLSASEREVLVNRMQAAA
ncbi:MAG: aldo/keto reductase [Chloroflexi bacterium]|nr:MAG: aldo/keto reductase [Chloroflexota bacterium]TME46730.1 MAG: aldo/keto reductase [Chloroflexota bacterium]